MNVGAALFGMVREEFSILRQQLLLAVNALESDSEQVRDCTLEMLQKSLEREPQSITLLEQMLRTARQASDNPQ